MPYFVLVGRDDKNLSGNTSKGYFIRRSGNVVTVDFGAIHCRNRKYYWAGHNLPIRKTRKFKTEEEAIWLYKDRTRRRKTEGYSQLRSDARIYSYSRFEK